MSANSEPWTKALRALLPVVSVALFALMVLLVLMAAGKTLGYDFEAYWGAAHRLAAGERLYDPNVSVAGGFAIFLYPPPFALAVAALLPLQHDAALFAWETLLVLCLPAGALILPVKRDIRWLIILLAAFDWPFLYSVKLGQVGPILFLLFAVAWRWIDSPRPAAAAIAAGALIKVQPAILILWAAATGHRRTAVYATVIGGVAVAATTVLTGFGAWPDYLNLLGRVSAGVTAFRNTSPGAIAYIAGLPLPAANAVQWLATGAVVVALLLSWRYATPVIGLQVTIIASQLLSPLLWEHYALLLILPTAWLMNRGRVWAIAFPLSGWIVSLAFPVAAVSAGPGTGVSWEAAASIPVAFFACLAVLLVEAYLERPRREPREESTRLGATDSPSTSG